MTQHENPGFWDYVIWWHLVSTARRSYDWNDFTVQAAATLAESV